MTPEEVAKHDREIIDRIVRRASIFSEGVNTPFWEELKVMFKELEAKAFARFTDANASDTAIIIELQQIGKLGRVLEAKVLSAIAEVENLTQ